MFALDPRLEADTAPVLDLELCALRLMNNRLFPWAILGPRRPGVVALFRLEEAGRQLLMHEISMVSEAMERLFAPDRINVGQLGNVVAQLHVHVVARFATDPAWPGPVWGAGHAAEYDECGLGVAVERLRDAVLACAGR